MIFEMLIAWWPPACFGFEYCLSAVLRAAQVVAQQQAVGLHCEVWHEDGEAKRTGGLG